MEHKIGVYPYSHREAEREKELPFWRESYRANIACAVDMEHAAQEYGDAQLLEDAAKLLVDKWGFQRVNFVLANSLNYLKSAGEISGANREWACSVFVPPDQEHNPYFTVKAQPTVLNGLADQARAAFQALGLFSFAHCEADSAELNYTGKVVVMSAQALREDCWTQQNQLWYAHSGNGCKPHAIGRSILCTCLSDGEQGSLLRGDITGVMREECLPGWALEKLEELRTPRQDGQEQGLGGIDMT